MASSLRHFLLAACAVGCCSLSMAAEPGVRVYIFGPQLQEGDGVLMWEQMTDEQKARLWPLLSREQRLVKWRQMSAQERRTMRENMTPADRRSLKRRFVIDHVSPEDIKNLKTRKMTPEERQLLRRQVIEVHVEVRGGGPYNCKDPTDCSRLRMKQGEHSAQARAKAPAPAAKPAAPTLTVPASMREPAPAAP